MTEHIKLTVGTNGLSVEDDKDLCVFAVFSNSPTEETQYNFAEIQAFLYHVLDYFYTDGRHSKARIRINITHGDKYECKNKKCVICQKGNL